jgi:beta-glucosidase
MDEARIEKLVAELTLDEKAALTAGADLWHSVAVPRVGIPGMVLSDGPSGARGADMSEGATSALFPCGAALGATWNPELVGLVAQAIAEDARTKGVNVLLGPTVNLHRTPLGGRNFECYSEDPELTARIAVAFVRGLQARAVSACVKHFAANDSEWERMSSSSEVDMRTLRELYLVPFEAAVREAGAWSVMSAYNKLNGTYASEHPWLLGELLKREWGFDGAVVSDWIGTHSTAPMANAGLDLEMPGPARFFGAKLADAVRAGSVPESLLDDKVRRLLRLALRTRAFDEPFAGPERAVDRPEHRALARRAAGEAIVLLKNDGAALPLESPRLRRLAVIGPNAARAVVQGGGSARVRPHYAVSPLEGIRKRAGDGVEVHYELGCTNHKTLATLGAELLAGPLALEFWNGHEFRGAPALAREASALHFTWFGSVAPEVDARAFCLRARGRLTARHSGRYGFSLVSAGKSKLFVDGELLIDNWTKQSPGDAFFNLGSAEVRAEKSFEAGRSCEILVEFSNEGRPMLGGLKVGCAEPQPEDLLERAVSRAAACDAAVVVVGLNDEWESEGHDRQDMELPGRQLELIERVTAANPRTVVVVNAGAPVRLEFLARVPGVLQLWYPGQESGNALADVLFGDVNPSGRLPTTFPRRLEDTPAFTHWPGERGRAEYREGLFVGYRWYDARKLEPAAPFGHGLSYTSFGYGALRLSRASLRAGESLELELDVRNTGARAGQEVVQLYVGALSSKRLRPPRELRAFRKIALAPDESRAVRFALAPRAFASWDAEAGGWAAEPGDFEISVGSSSRDLRARATVTVETA